MSRVLRLLVVGLVIAGGAGVSLWVGSPGDGTGPVLAGDALGGSLGFGDPMGSLPVVGGQVSASGAHSVGLSGGRWMGVQSATAKVRSRLAFAHLDAERAARVAGEAFPAQVVQRAGGLPLLPRGQRIVRFVSDRAAQLALPHGKRAVIESMQPIAVQTSTGQRLPVDLGLTRTGGVFESVRPLVGVLIPSHAREGVHFPGAGISLTPTDSHGGALGGAGGTVDGASVLYANTQTDADTVVKPTLAGVETSTVLRSVDSPSTLYYRVGLPAGARLVQSRAGVGPVVVLEGSRPVVMVRSPGAIDSAGSTVPVSMSVSGGLLAVSVSATSGNYQWPIDVDPEIVIDESFGPEQCHQKGEAERESSNWCWHPSSPKFKSTWYTGENTAVDMWNEGATNAGEYGVMSYLTQGESKIYEAGAYTDGYLTGGVAKFEFAHERSVESGALETGGEDILPQEHEYKTFSYNHFCANTKSEGTCSSSEGSAKNLVAVKAEASRLLTETYNIDFGVQNTKVYISQTKGPEASLDTIDEHPLGAPSRENVAFTHGWLSPANGAFEYIIKDPGIGVSEAGIQEMGGGSIHLKVPIYEEGKCNGVQCKEEYRSAMTYSPEMADGEDKFELWGRDKAGFFGYIGFSESEKMTVIKVDGSKPYNLGLTGMPEEGAEVSAAPHTLSVHATDGTAPTKSSGVRSLSVSVDGGAEAAVSGASCPEGPCTVSGNYTLAAENLSEGVHRLVLTATDNAGNVAAREITFDVRHGTPLPVGPGAVDPTTGQLKLSATDVSLAGSGGVSRVFQSRNLTAGSYGPLGSQWALSLGAGEGMTVLPSGSVVLASSAGGTTTFWRNGAGEFQSPLGDGNVKVEAKEKEAGKGISEYLLKDAKAGTTTVFTQPVGTEATIPVYANQFGQQGAALANPVSDAIDAHGNVWVTDYTGDRILEFSPAGVLLHAYGSAGPYPSEFNDPWGIAVNKSTGNVYVSDPGNNRMVELNSSGGFVRAFGWAVSPGGTRKEEFQNCTAYCEAGSAGAGAGQFNWPQGVAVDASGNVWVAEYNNNRLQEFDAEGKYLHSYGTAGTAGGQFEGPMNIAFSANNLFVTDQNNNRVQELTNTGGFVEAIGWGVSNGEAKLQVCTSGCRAGSAGSGNGQFNGPRGLAIDAAGNLYVSEITNNRVQQLTSAGAFVTMFGSSGSGNGQLSQPMGVALGPSKEIYVTDWGNKRVQEWMRPAWLPARSEGALKNVSTAYAYEAVAEEGKTVVEPTEALAATPAGITCVGPHGEVEVGYLQKGCRALTFNYASSSTATGEKPTQWGDHTGDLTRVYLHAWDPSSGTMKTTAVAHYLYDTKGRLRAVWDPRIEPEPEKCAKEPLAHGCLVTVYGYDEEGHITAVTPPGRETWGVLYGTISGDSNTGRVLKAKRAPASASLWTGAAPVKLENPKLSGTPAVGVRMSVTTGIWANSSVVYGYQWQDCNSEGKSCTNILGATNANYTPASSDVGHTLIAQVTAVNGGGSIMAPTTSSSMVVAKAGYYAQTIDSGHSLNTVSCIPSTTDCVASDSLGKVFYATNVSSSSTGTWNAWSGPGASPGDAVACPATSLCLLAAGSKEGNGGNLYYATSLGGSWTQAYAPTYGVDAISCVSTTFCVDGQDGSGYFRYSTTPASTSWTLEDQGSAAMKGVFCLSTSFCAMADNKGTVHIANSTGQIESSAWKETNVNGTTALNGITCTSTSSCIAVDVAGNVLNLTIESSGTASATKHNIDGTNALTGVTCASSTCVTVDTVGNVFVSQNKGETWTNKYSLGDNLTSVSCASTSLCTAVDTAGAVTALNPSGSVSEGESVSPQPGSTIEYRVPVSGAGAPHNLSKEEVEKWGQKDTSEWENNDPAEATAVFPSDEPQTWPATGYKRATIDYMNGKGLTVNAAAPTGGIATTEYNELNEVVRTLSPDNLATALNEGCVSLPKKECKSAEVAEKLDTQTEYGPEGSEIVKVLGPEHKIKLSSGTEVMARGITHNYYDEGAEEAEEKNGEEYNLLTKSVSGALLANGEEVDKRTTITSYNGQNYLGWKLRQPTSTTADPTGLKLTTTTVYNEATGQIVETQTPSANNEATASIKSFSSFGGSGSGAGQLSGPSGVAVDSSHNVWVADTGHNRVQEFKSNGEFVREFGGTGSGNGAFSKPEGIAVGSSGNVYVADTGNARIQEFNSKGEFVRAFGTLGEGNGQFFEPKGVAVDGEGHVWTIEGGVLKTRVQEFTAEGVYMGQFGSSGTENGKFKTPKGIAVDAKGFVWVADTGNNRVQEFKPAGEFVRVFGSEGTTNGQFKKPVGLAFDAEGDLWIGDTGNNRVQRFTNEGAYLSQLGTVGNENGQFAEPKGIATDSSGNIWVADTSNNRIQELTGSEFVEKFGGSGSGAGQLSGPSGVAVDSSHNVWVADTGHNRVQEFKSNGEFVREFGGTGSGNGAFSKPEGIAVGSSGNVYVADTGNARIQEFNSKGEFVRAFGTLGEGNGQFFEPKGVAVDGEGHVWTIEGGVLKTRVQEFTAEGVYMGQFGSSGTENGKFKTPKGIAVDAKGFVWVADTGNNRVQEFKPAGEFVRVFGSEGTTNGQFKKPVGLAFDAEGDLWIGDTGNNRVQRFTNEGAYLSQLGTVGNENGQFAEPKGIATDSSGNIWVADTSNNRIQELTGSEFVEKFGGSGSGAGQLSGPSGVAVDSSHNVWVADTGHNRVQEFKSNGEFVREFGGTGSGNGAFSKPEGIAVGSSGNVYVADTGNARIQEFNSKGEFVRAFGTLGEGNGQFFEPKGVAVDGEGHVWTIEGGVLKTRVQEFTAEGVYMGQFGSSGTENGKFKTPKGIAVDAKGFVWVADTGNNRVQEFKPAGEFVRVFGSEGTTNGQFKKPVGLAFDAEGDLWIGDTGNNRVQRFTNEGAYLSQLGTVGNENGQFAEPKGIATDSSGNIWVADTSNNRIDSWIPEHRFVNDAKTVYYTPEKEARVEVCQNHPEWANLPCRIEPAAQPIDAGKGQPSLPLTTMSYNIWDEIEVTTEQFGTGSGQVNREKIETYDSAGRALTSEEKATPATDTSLPKVSNEYNSETGVLEKQSATIKGETKTVTEKDNTLGQPIEYTDATGNVAKYVYEEGSDGRLLEASEGKGAEAKSSQTYSYDPTTGLMTKLVDSAAGTFTASYDVEGKMTSEVYPNGMCANTTYDPTGAATSISYIKTRNCSESNPTVWFSDSVLSGAHGETFLQTSTLATESYGYDSAGRLLETQETPVGKGCTIRLYAYDEESNRTSLTTRTPGFEGKCATEGGTVQSHVYDEANRLTDTSVEYETFGNTTKLPAADAGEHEIFSTYYVDGQVATQEQNKTLDTYLYDPAGRTMEATTENTETKAKSTIFSHYAGTGNAPTWTSEGTEKWSRNIAGIDGSLCATQTSGSTPVLQLHDLQGNVVATAADNETETKLLSTYNSTEFGVPSEGKTPPKYAWLGASGLATETSFGTGVSTQGGASYVPQVARDLQTAPVIPPGAFPNGQGSGEQYGSEIPGWYISLSGQESANTLAEWTAKQEQLKKEAEEAECRANPDACSEDPSWSGDVSIGAAKAIAGAIEGLEIAYYLSGGELAKEVVKILAEHLKVNFVKQLNEDIEHGIFGYSLDEVAKWTFRLGGLLSTCAEKAEEGVDKPKAPHCWVYFPTVIRKIYRGDPGSPIPNFAINATVGYCPWGRYSKCFVQNIM